MAAVLTTPLNQPFNLLVVEDHLALREVTVEILAGRGYRVIGVESAEAMDELPAGFVVHIAILDLNLPGEDGLALAERLRQVQPGIGIIMVTARQALVEKVAGYQSGADIYLTKPTHSDELCAAVESLSRRLALAQRPAAAFLLDTSRHMLITCQGELRLRKAEVLLLNALALAPAQTLETWQLLDRLGKPVDEPGKKQLEVMISRLRSKLTAYGIPGNALLAERRRGYRLCLSLQVS